MGFWSSWVFPRLCHRTMRGDPFHALRRDLLSTARGRVLELGIGTGLNLEHYPTAAQHIDGVDPNPGMHSLARRTLEDLGGKEAEGGLPDIALHEARGEALPFPDGAFDTAVSTWTLCSVEEPAAVFAEIHRVLAPGGRLLMLEHGVSHEPKVARWQRRLTPLQHRFADGCHIDRDFSRLLTGSPLETLQEERFYIDGVPKLGGYHYRMVAVRR